MITIIVTVMVIKKSPNRLIFLAWTASEIILLGGEIMILVVKMKEVLG